MKRNKTKIRINEKNLINMIRFYFGLCITISILLLNFFEKSEILQNVTNNGAEDLALSLYPFFIIGLIIGLVLFELVNLFRKKVFISTFYYLLGILFLYCLKIVGLFYEGSTWFLLLILAMPISGVLITVVAFKLLFKLLFNIEVII